MLAKAYQPVIQGGNFTTTQIGDLHIHSHSADSALARTGKHTPFSQKHSWKEEVDLRDRLGFIAQEHSTWRIPRLRRTIRRTKMPSGNKESDLEMDHVLDRGPRYT